MKEQFWEIIQKVKKQSPLVFSITNLVVMNNTANALLAAGASPIMAHAHSEVEDMVAICDALVINIGTLDEYLVKSMLLAAEKANSLQKPWILDPVGAGATPFRNKVLNELLALKPTVIRGNASEILSLANQSKTVTKGVDSTSESSTAISAAKYLNQTYDSIVAISGAVDYVIDGHKCVALSNGSPLMTKVTGLGCSSSALIGAFLVVEKEVVLAVSSAISLLSVAGEIASENVIGPGSLQISILDKMYNLTLGEFSQYLKGSGYE